MRLEAFHDLDPHQATEAIRGWCGSSSFVTQMEKLRPFASLSDVHSEADRVFESLLNKDWLEAFAAHPRLGDLDSLKMKYAGNREWSANEQSGVQSANEDVLHQLANLNETYFQRFGFIFILKASGATAMDMLTAIRDRIDNDRDHEVGIASQQQRLITHLRIDKQFSDSDST